MLLRCLALAALTYAQNASRIEYNVLIVGDVHDDLAAIDELRSRFGRQSSKYHLLLCTGDLTTMPHGNVEGSAKPEATPHTNAFVSKASGSGASLSDVGTARVFRAGGARPARTVRGRRRDCPRASRGTPTTWWKKVTSALWVAGWGEPPCPLKEMRTAKDGRRTSRRRTPGTGAGRNFPSMSGRRSGASSHGGGRVSKVPAGRRCDFIDARRARRVGDVARDGAGRRFRRAAGKRACATATAGSIALGEFLRQRATQQRVVLHAHGRAHAALGVARWARWS